MLAGGGGGSSAQASASAQSVVAQNMDVYAHPDLGLILGKVVVVNKAASDVPCAGLQFELTPKDDGAAPLVGPLSCPGDHVPAGGQLTCGFAAQADAQAYAGAGAAFANAEGYAGGGQEYHDGPPCDDGPDLVYAHHNRPPFRGHHGLFEPILFKRPPRLFGKHFHGLSAPPPPPPRLELCADALGQAFGEDAYGMALSHGKQDSSVDVYALATAVVHTKFEAPKPQIVEKIVEVPKIVVKEVPGPVQYKDRIVEKEVIKEVVKEVPGPVQYKDRIVEKQVVKEVPGPVQYKDRIVEKQVPGPVQYKDRIVEKEVIKEVPGPVQYKDRIVEKEVIKEVPVPGPERVVVVEKPVLLVKSKYSHHDKHSGAFTKCDGPCDGYGR